MGKAKKKKEAKVAKVDSKPRINHLTGLRFFAAFLVFMSHIEFSGSYDSLQIVFKQGFIGVSFFFILSGFVLSYSHNEAPFEEVNVDARSELDLKQYKLN